MKIHRTLRDELWMSQGAGFEMQSSALTVAGFFREAAQSRGERQKGRISQELEDIFLSPRSFSGRGQLNDGDVDENAPSACFT